MENEIIGAACNNIYGGIGRIVDNFLATAQYFATTSWRLDDVVVDDDGEGGCCEERGSDVDAKRSFDRPSTKLLSVENFEKHEPAYPGIGGGDPGPMPFAWAALMARLVS